MHEPVAMRVMQRVFTKKEHMRRSCAPPTRPEHPTNASMRPVPDPCSDPALTTLWLSLWMWMRGKPQVIRGWSGQPSQQFGIFRARHDKHGKVGAWKPHRAPRLRCQNDNCLLFSAQAVARLERVGAWKPHGILWRHHPPPQQVTIFCTCRRGHRGVGPWEAPRNSRVV